MVLNLYKFFKNLLLLYIINYIRNIKKIILNKLNIFILLIDIIPDMI